MAGPTAEVAPLVGRTLGHYRILAKIGEGGMGEVYRAHDERLDCDVAIKVLPPGSVSDESARKQFQKEARALARLNHPNIAIVHHFDTQQGVDYLVMEYIPGTTLSEKLAQAKLAEKEVIRLGVQLAEGLSAAHEHGVIHSDVKPSNLRLTEDGRLKILDFGLAKLRLPVTTTATTESFSEKRSVAGTLPYMAPEQLLAGEVDARTDIHAAGCVLYEMATGKRPFAEVETSKLISAILNRTPLSPATINPGLPAELERIIGKCLEKEPENRYQSARELAIDLRRLQAATTSGPHESGSLQGEGRHRHTLLSRRMLLPLTGAVLVLIMSFAYWFTRPLPPPRIMNATQLTNNGRDKLLNMESATFPLVTDGSRVYFQEVNSGGVGVVSHVSIAGGETNAVSSEIPFSTLMDVSPTRSELLVGAYGTDPEPRLEILPLPAGSPRSFSDLRGHDASWSADGNRVVYARGSDLYIASGDGARPQKVVRANGAVFRPRWSPDGNKLRFTVRDTVTRIRAIWEVAPNGTHLRPLLPSWPNPADDCCGNWTPDGRFFIFQSTQEGKTNIWAVRESRSFFRRVTTAPVPLTTGGINYFAPVVSRDGKQIFVKGAIPRGEIVRYEAHSRQFVPYLAGVSAEDLDFSRDGAWVTYVAYPQRTLWRSRIDGSDRLQLTLSPMRVFLPRWSPDGRSIAFAAGLPGQHWRIYIISSEGGRPEQVTRGEVDEGDVGWSADGAALAFGTMGFGPQSPHCRSIQILNLKTGRLVALPASEGLFSPRWSPDGRYIAALPVEQDKLLIYDFETSKWMKRPTSNPGFPSWSRDSKYVYFDSLSPTEPAFVRVRISDGKMEKVADLKNVQRATSLFGAWSGLGPDDSPLVLRDTGTQEIYALDWEAP